MEKKDHALVRVQELLTIACQNTVQQMPITEKGREKVVKYINELAEDFKFYHQTATLACNYFDRYIATLMGSNVDKALVQMIASTSLLMAAKFSDRKLPPLSELKKVHHDRCDTSEFADLELKMLEALQWKLHVPLPSSFVDPLRALCIGAPFDANIEERVSFFIDLSVYGYKFLAYSHAAIAAACMLIAWHVSGENAATRRFLEPLANAVEMQPKQLVDCVHALDDYNQSCFPEAAKKHHHLSVANAFVPIPSNGCTPTSPESPAAGASVRV